MTLEELKKNVKFLHDEMRLLTYKAGVKADRYNRFLFGYDDWTLDVAEAKLSILNKINANEYTQAKKIWFQHNITPEQWHQYKLLGRNLPEYRDLRKAFSNLKDVWNATVKMLPGVKSGKKKITIKTEN